MQYPADMDNIKDGIDEINHAMPPKENSWLLKRERVLTQWGKDFTKRWERTTKQT